MTPTLTGSPARLLVIVVLGLVLTLLKGRLFRWSQALGWEHLLQSRIQYLVLGLLLSKMGLGILDTGPIQQFDAVVTLGLGILGLQLGLSFSAPREDKRLVQAAALESGATLLLVGGAFFFALDVLSALTWQQRALAAALVGCAAAISGRRLFDARARDEQPFLPLNRIADLGTVFGILAAGALLALLNPSAHLSSAEKLLALGVIGTVGGLGAWLLASDMKPSPLRTALLLGILLVTAGTATHLALPPVAATLLMGLTIAKLPGPLPAELRASLAFLQSPCRALLLVIAGSALPLPTGLIVAMVALFLALRAAGKILGGRVASSLAQDLPEHMGLGLLPSSAIAVGLALDFRATAPAEIADIVVATTVLGSLLSETVGLWTTLALARAHSLSEAAVEAVATVTAPEPPQTQEIP